MYFFLSILKSILKRDFLTNLHLLQNLEDFYHCATDLGNHMAEFRLPSLQSIPVLCYNGDRKKKKRQKRLNRGQEGLYTLGLQRVICGIGLFAFIQLTCVSKKIARSAGGGLAANQVTNHTIGWTKQTLFTWNGMYLSSEPGEMAGLSFKGVTLLISGLLSIKMTEIICVSEMRQQGIVHVRSKSGFSLFFLMLLKIALHILRSYLREKTLKKCVDINQKIFHKTAGSFFSLLLFW